MAAIKKGTKLTKNPKDFMLRVRLDSQTLSKLDDVCFQEDKSRSEVVREGIDEKYKKIKK